MRVISGKAKGLKLNTVEGLETRPTTDKVKEAIFSMIGPNIHDYKCLDLFSGSGALGIEAASRGASYVVLVDNSKNVTTVMNDNIKKARFTELMEVKCMDVLEYVRGYKGNTFDLIFMDPPYFKGFIPDVLKLIDQKGLLSDQGQIICEHDDSEALPETVGGFKRLKVKKYGRIGVSVYGRE